MEFKAQSQQMQQRNGKERFAGLHINDSHNFSDIMQQYRSSMGMQSPWQQQSMMPQMMQQGPPNYMMQKQQSMMPPIMPQGQPNYMMPQPNQQGPPPNYMMPQPNNYWCFPNGMMQQQNELNGNGATFSTMQQQASAFHKDKQVFAGLCASLKKKNRGGHSSEKTVILLIPRKRVHLVSLGFSTKKTFFCSTRVLDC